MTQTTLAQKRYTRFSYPNPQCTRFSCPGEGNIAHRSWSGHDDTMRPGAASTRLLIPSQQESGYQSRDDEQDHGKQSKQARPRFDRLDTCLSKAQSPFRIAQTCLASWPMRILGHGMLNKDTDLTQAHVQGVRLNHAIFLGRRGSLV